ncbi:MAG: cation diffusion facilitator family transporter [Chloroflexota bacterium]
MNQTQYNDIPDTDRDGSRLSRVRFVLIVILALNFGVAIAKIAVGLAVGSLAMSADGVHSLLDGASNIIALIGIAVAARPPDRDHPYGHHRFETLTSLGIAAFMLLALYGILQGAYERVTGGGGPEIGTVALITMLVTLAINLAVTTWERREGRRLKSSVLLADSRHTLSDVFVSLSVIASFGLIELGFGGADVAVTLVIAGLIAWGAWQIVRDATLVLADSAVEEPTDIRETVLSVPGVHGAHAIRSRGGEDRVWVDLHIQVNPEMSVEDGHEIASEVARRVEDEFKRPADVTVHVEPATDYHLKQVRHYEDDRGRNTA